MKTIMILTFKLEDNTFSKGRSTGKWIRVEIEMISLRLPIK